MRRASPIALVATIAVTGCRPPATPTVVVPTEAAAELAVDLLDDAYPFTCEFGDDPSESLAWLLELGDLGYGFLGDTDPNPSIEAFRTLEGSLVLRRIHRPDAVDVSLAWSTGERTRVNARYLEVGGEAAIGRLETLVAIDHERVVGWFCDKAFGIASACRYAVVRPGSEAPTRLGDEDLAPLFESVSAELDGDHLFVVGRLVDRGSDSGDHPLVLDTIDLHAGTAVRTTTSILVGDGYYGLVVSDAAPRFVIPEPGTGELRVLDASGAPVRTLRTRSSTACDEREVPRARVRLPFDLEGDLDVGASRATIFPADVITMGVRGSDVCDLAIEIEHRDGGPGSYEGAVAMRLDPVALGPSRFVFVGGEAEVVCASE